MADNKHTVEFEGQTFELQTGPVNELVMSEFFAAVADQDPNRDVPHEVMLSLLEASIVAKDWPRFRKLGRKTDNFWNKAVKVFEMRLEGPVEKQTGHPTEQPSVSTDGPEVILPKSELNSDAKIFELAHGRLDRYKMLKDAQKAARSA